MAGLTKNQKERLKSFGIKATTEDKARSEMVKFLEENEIDGLEDEETDFLIEAVATFHEEGSTEDLSEEEALAAEAEEEEEPEEVEEYEEEEEPEEVEEYEEEEEPEEVEEYEEEEEPKPKAKRRGRKPSNKKTEEKPKTAAKTKGRRGRRKSGYSPLLVKDGGKRALNKISAITDLFDEDEYWIKPLKQGITIYLNLKNKRRAIISYDRIRVKDKEVIGDLFFNPLKGRKEVEEFVDGAEDHDIKNFNMNLAFIPKLTVEDSAEMLTEELINLLRERLEASDARLGKSKKQLEKSMESEKAKSQAKKSTKKRGRKTTTTTAKKPTTKRRRKTSKVS